MSRNRVILVIDACVKLRAGGRREAIRARRLQVVEKRLQELREDPRFQDHTCGDGCALRTEFCQLAGELACLETGCQPYDATAFFTTNEIQQPNE